MMLLCYLKKLLLISCIDNSASKRILLHVILFTAFTCFFCNTVFVSVICISVYVPDFAVPHVIAQIRLMKIIQTVTVPCKLYLLAAL